MQPPKKSREIVLVLITAGALLSQVTGCPADRLHEADKSGGGVFYMSSDDVQNGSGYNIHYGGVSGGIGHGGFGGHGGGHGGGGGGG